MTSRNKTIIFTCMLTFLSAGHVSGYENKQETTAFSEENIINLFVESLTQATTAPFKCKRYLREKQIDSMRERIWTWWKTANNQLKEEKLPPLKQLSKGEKNTWTLPRETNDKTIMPFYWGYKGECPENGYPLFLYLHGSGPKQAEWNTGWKLAQSFDDAPSTYFIPQIPNEGEYYRWWQKAKITAWNKLFRQAMLSDSINPNRLYCFGISEGGYGSQRLSAYYADYLAAAGPMAGGEPLINAPAENYMNLGFSMLTGANDFGFYRHILTQYTKKTIDSLEQQYPQYYSHRINLIPGKGHSIDYSPTTPWLKTFTRIAQPKQFIWENFAMDGVYRNGFYNIAVLERSNKNADERTVYTMRIDNNRIDLTVKNVTYETIEKDPHWGIGLDFKKTYTEVTKGKFLLYLSPELVNLNEKVAVYLNGKKIYDAKVPMRMEHLINSCTTFSDPERLFPAAVFIDLKKYATAHKSVI